MGGLDHFPDCTYVTGDKIRSRCNGLWATGRGEFQATGIEINPLNKAYAFRKLPTRFLLPFENPNSM